MTPSPFYSVGFAVVPIATHGGCEQLCGLARFKDDERMGLAGSVAADQ